MYIASDFEGMAHYVCYARRADGYWELHNDLWRKIKRLTSLKSIKVNPHLLYYIKNN